MKTQLLKFSKNNVAVAAEVIKNGGVVAFPTETVYGLGANAFDARAVEKIFAAKGRPSDNPLIVHVCRKSQIDQIACDLSEDAERIIDRLMPDSLTLVLKKRSCIPSNVTAGLDTVAVRMPKSRRQTGREDPVRQPPSRWRRIWMAGCRLFCPASPAASG